MSGLNSRQKFNVNDIKFERQSQNEKNEILELEKLISNNSYFKTLEVKIQNNILKNKSAREFGWEKMIDSSDLKSIFFKPMWKLFSNTAHSELIGAIQLKKFVTSDRENLHDELCSNIFYATILNASLISNIKENFLNTERIFNSLSDEFSSQIEMWSNISRNENKKD